MIFILFYFFKINNKNDYLKVVFLDVGQGDAIYIESPNGKQILIDGGPDAKLLSSLSKIMPFADRSIDMVMFTHPDMDHIGGLPVLLDNYTVSNIIENGSFSDSDVYTSLEEKIKSNKINKIIAKKGTRIVLDKEKNIFVDILFPDRDPNTLESNDASIVAKLIYGDTSFMFTGDASIYTENQLWWNEQDTTLDSDVLKLGHHGAKTSSSILWLMKVTPDIAIISSGKNNRYGHPNKEVLDRLDDLEIPYLKTSDEGNIIFKSDGVKILR